MTLATDYDDGRGVGVRARGFGAHGQDVGAGIRVHGAGSFFGGTHHGIVPSSRRSQRGVVEGDGVRGRVGELLLLAGSDREMAVSAA